MVAKVATGNAVRKPLRFRALRDEVFPRQIILVS